MSNSPENENFKLSRESSAKFEFYFIALVFTILGLSIQTSVLTEKFYQYIFELLSWAMLLISGLAGLSRLEWMGPYYAQSGTMQDLNKEIKIFQQGLKGRPILKSQRVAWTKEEMEKEHSEL